MGICGSKETVEKLPCGTVHYSSMNSTFSSGPQNPPTRRGDATPAKNESPTDGMNSRAVIDIIDEFRGRQQRRLSNAHAGELYSEGDDTNEEKDENNIGDDKKVTAIRGMSGLKLEKKIEIKRDIEKEIRDRINLNKIPGDGKDALDNAEKIKAEEEKKEIEQKARIEAIKTKRIARELLLKEKEAADIERLKNEYKNKVADIENEKKMKSETNRRMMEERLEYENKQSEETAEYHLRKKERIQKMEEERLAKEEARKHSGSVLLPGTRSVLLSDEIKRIARLRKLEAEKLLKESSGISTDNVTENEECKNSTCENEAEPIV